MSEELKPCPFCGGEAHIKEVVSACEKLYTVGCSDSECMGYETWLLKPTVDEAVAAWNRRAERTCRFETHQEPEGGEVWSECGECGAQFGWDCWQCIESASYCPNCGAKVVDDDN